MLQLRKRADKSGPEPPRNKVERVDENAAGELEPVLTNPNLPVGALLEPWPIAHVELVGDAPAEHNFADTFVATAIADGYLEIVKPRPASSSVPPGVPAYDRDPVVTGDEIVLHLVDGDLRYRVLEHPGKYADETEASGWRVTHEYRCKIVKGR